MRKQGFNRQSILMLIVIVAFIAGVAIGVCNIFDFSMSSDEGDNITYTNVTNNVSYYENLSANNSVSDNYDNDESYNDSVLKVYNASDFTNSTE